MLLLKNSESRPFTNSLLSLPGNVGMWRFSWSVGYVYSKKIGLADLTDYRDDSLIS